MQNRNGFTISYSLMKRRNPSICALPLMTLPLWTGDLIRNNNSRRRPSAPSVRRGCGNATRAHRACSRCLAQGGCGHVCYQVILITLNHLGHPNVLSLLVLYGLSSRESWYSRASITRTSKIQTIDNPDSILVKKSINCTVFCKYICMFILYITYVRIFFH